MFGQGINLQKIFLVNTVTKSETHIAAAAKRKKKKKKERKKKKKLCVLKIYYANMVSKSTGSCLGLWFDILPLLQIIFFFIHSVCMSSVLHHIFL